MQLHTGPDGDGLWIGRHAADGDTLVFDPAHSETGSANISLFSLTQFRPRAFPPGVVQKQIEEIINPEQRALAEERYRAWPTLKAERDRGLERVRADEVVRQRDRILEKHRLFLENQNLPYEGVQDSSVAGGGSSPRRRRTSCHLCGISLDDFVGAKCGACGSVLCSCGACGCGAPRKGS